MNEVKKDAPKRGEVLKGLREVHASTVKNAQLLVRDQKQFQQAITNAISESPKTIPDIASQIGKPTHEVLWHVMAMKKYGLIVETGMGDDYPLYILAKESEA